MVVVTPQLAINAPAGEVQTGRGFYQVDEEILYVQLGEFRRGKRFFNYLESGLVRLDFDKEGLLCFIEVSLPRRRWPVSENLIVPGAAEPADVRWLDFRSRLREPEIETDSAQSCLHIRFSDQPVHRTIALGEAILLDVSDRQSATGLWITLIEEDFAGRALAASRLARAQASLQVSN